MAKPGVFDLEKHFAFYGAYHSNPVNVFIHMIFVWPILFTALVILYFTPSVFHLPQIQFYSYGTLVLNFGFFSTLIYAIFYICLDKKAGSLAAIMCFLCWVGGSLLASRLGYSLAWKLPGFISKAALLHGVEVVLASQVFCWTGQFIGHGVFEKRAPALLDNLTQAFVMAPFFVLLEALQMFFGYEPYPGFHSKVQTEIDAQIKEYQQKKQKKTT